MTTIFDDQNKPLAFLGIQNDISQLNSERRRIQSQTQLEALGAFSANISHEVKNSIQPIRLMADTLLDWKDMPEETVDECISLLRSHVECTDNIVRSILKYSKPQNSLTDEIYAHDLFQDTCEFIHKNKQTSTHFQPVELSSSLQSYSVNINKTHFFQIMLNFLQNSEYAFGKSTERDNEVFFDIEYSKSYKTFR